MVTVRKLNQEGRIYYYLEHPVKVNGKVKKYSKYLGRELPTDIEEVKTQFLLEINRSRWSALSDLAKERMEALTRNLSAEELEQFYHNNALHFTTNSLRIAGSSITLLELMRLIEDSTVPKWRSQREIIEAKAHYNIVKSIFHDKPEFSFDLLVDWHWKLFRESRPAIAGLIRTKVEASTKGDYGYGLDSYYSESAEDTDKVMLPALINLKLSGDQPFQEGNEIIARLAMNSILCAHGFPILDIEFNERKRYEEALEKSKSLDGDNAFLKWYFLKYSRKLAGLEPISR